LLRIPRPRHQDTGIAEPEVETFDTMTPLDFLNFEFTHSFLCFQTPIPLDRGCPRLQMDIRHQQDYYKRTNARFSQTDLVKIKSSEASKTFATRE
jgi:hypothetical protein